MIKHHQHQLRLSVCLNQFSPQTCSSDRFFRPSVCLNQFSPQTCSSGRQSVSTSSLLRLVLQTVSLSQPVLSSDLFFRPSVCLNQFSPQTCSSDRQTCSSVRQSVSTSSLLRPVLLVVSLSQPVLSSDLFFRPSVCLNQFSPQTGSSDRQSASTSSLLRLVLLTVRPVLLTVSLSQPVLSSDWFFRPSVCLNQLSPQTCSSDRQTCSSHRQSVSTTSLLRLVLPRNPQQNL